MRKYLYALLLLPSLSWAGTITTFYNPLGTIYFSSGTTPTSNITLSTHTTAASANNNTVVTPGITTTGATLIVMVVAYSPGGTFTGVSDSNNNVWQLMQTETGTNGFGALKVFYSTGPTVGASHTFTVTGTTIYPAVAVSAWNGVVTPGSFDHKNGATGSNVGTLQPGSVTPGANNELIITGYGENPDGTPGTTLSINSGFTILDQISRVGGSYNGIGDAYLIQSAATAENPTWTSSVPTAFDSEAIIGTFKSQ